MSENQYTGTDYLFALYPYATNTEEIEKMSDFQRKCAIKELDKKIEIIGAFINEIRDYTNPFRYITFRPSFTNSASVHSENITVEITPELYNSNIELIKQEWALSPNLSHLRQLILSKYSDLDYHKKYKLSGEISIETKIHIIYAERLQHIQNHYDRLPEKYKKVFKENNYCNIYNIVKSELLEKLNMHIAQKIKILTIQ
jgi:hypothetical protein